MTRSTSGSVFARMVLTFAVAFALCACGHGHKGRRNGGGGEDPLPTGQLRFSDLTLEVGEAAGTATAMVARVDGSRGAISVSVTSADGTADAGADYTPLTTTVSFADGDSTPKPVTFNVANDTLVEEDETVILTLSDPVGDTMLASSTCIVFINDDDEDDGAAPPTAASLAIGFEVKRLAFAWTAAARAAVYKLMRRESPNSDFVQVGADLPQTAGSAKLPIATHLYDWNPAGPQYRLDACNDGGCATSNIVSTIRVVSALTTGYVKSSATVAGARFGTAVAVSGNGKTAAIGAPFENGESGSVYIYTAPAAGNVPSSPGPAFIGQPLRIQAPSAQAMHFGAAVALNETGDVLVVGAPFDNHLQSGPGTYPVTPNADATHSGGVFVYRRVGGVWSTQPVYIKAIDVDANDEFGSAVAVRGTILVVGAPGQDSSTDGTDVTNSAVDSGAAYVLQTTATGWIQSPRILKASNIGAGDRFGASVALDGIDGIAVGAPFEDGDGTGIDPVDTDTKQDSGAAYRFVIDDSLIGAVNPPPWNPPQRFKALNSGADDQYGTAVALSANGEVLAVGAPNEDGDALDVPDEAGNNVGALYVYTMPAGAAMDVAYLKALHRYNDAQYGASVAIDGNGTILAVGSPHESINEIGVDGDGVAPATDAGSVDVLVRAVGANWSSQGIAAPVRHYVKASNSGAGDLFGTSAALSSDGNTMVVGAPHEDGNGRNIDANNNPANNSLGDAGAAYLY